MPFTASHSAAVLGLARWGLPPSALVIGAAAPDLPMVLPFPAVVHFAHMPVGILTIDLAIGLVVFVVWQTMLAPVLIAAAPSGWRVRLPDNAPAGLRFHFGRSRKVALVLAAVVIGALTHVLWDTFTHDWMWGPAHIPWLAESHGPLMGYEWVRWISDVAGMTIVAGWVLRWWCAAAQRPGRTVVPRPHQVLVCLLILVPTAGAFLYWLVRGELFLAVTRGAGLGVAGLVVAAVTWRVRRRPGRPSAADPPAP
jgi:hypothetical protein